MELADRTIGEVCMITKKNLVDDLKNAGLLPTDSVLIHSSMKSVGEVEGRADTVIDAFMEYFCEGRVMFPTHTWAQMSEEYNVFDPAVEPACVGILPNLFMKREGVVRSLHPTHSMAVYGKNAEDYIRGEENCTTPCTPGGCWDRLRSINAKILLIGVNHIRNTYIHSIEEVFDVPERLTKKPVDFKIKMSDGTLKNVSMYRHYNPHTAHISESYDKLTKAFYETGAAKRVKFGDAECILCDAKKLFEVTGRILSHGINCIMDMDEIPEEFWH